MKRGTPKHPKIYHLCTLLKCRRPTAIGYLEMLWHLAADYTPQGNIGKYEDSWIEGSLDWAGRKGHLIKCLVESRWLDYEDLTMSDPSSTHSEWAGHRKLFVHDWHEHADSAVRKRLERLRLPFLKVAAKVTGQKPVSDQSAAPLARAPASALPQPDPSHQPHGEFPATAAAVREQYPETDDAFVMRLTIAVGQKAAGMNGKLKGEPTDALIAKAVRHCAKVSPNQNSAGLYLRTVPQCVASWLTNGEPAEATPNPIFRPEDYGIPS